MIVIAGKCADTLILTPLDCGQSSRHLHNEWTHFRSRFINSPTIYKWFTLNERHPAKVLADCVGCFRLYEATRRRVLIVFEAKKKNTVIYCFKPQAGCSLTVWSLALASLKSWGNTLKTRSMRSTLITIRISCVQLVSAPCGQPWCLQLISQA